MCRAEMVLRVRRTATKSYNELEQRGFALLDSWSVVKQASVNVHGTAMSVFQIPPAEIGNSSRTQSSPPVKTTILPFHLVISDRKMRRVTYACLVVFLLFGAAITGIHPEL